jgi:hypothetical protein
LKPDGISVTLLVELEGSNAMAKHPRTYITSFDAIKIVDGDACGNALAQPPTRAVPLAWRHPR